MMQKVDDVDMRGSVGGPWAFLTKSGSLIQTRLLFVIMVDTCLCGCTASVPSSRRKVRGWLVGSGGLFEKRVQDSMWDHE